MADHRERATSFGRFAEEYDRYRPGPVAEVVDWLLPRGAETVVDLGAGTGGLTRLLVGRVARLYSVEPDERMRRVLAARNPGATALAGRGDAIPLEDASVDALLVSSAWHWMDLEPTMAEIARVLRRGGRLGVVWSGPDRRVAWVGELLGRARRGLSPGESSRLVEDLAGTERRGDADRRLLIPPGSPFSPPEFTEIRWTRTMTADDLVGIAGTYSRVITLPEEARERLLAEARAWLERQPEMAEGGGMEVPFRAACWRTDRSG